MSEGWKTCNTHSPCPICGKPDWCGVSLDGRVCHCMRIESKHSTRRGGWLHWLTDEKQETRPPAARKKKPKPKRQKDFARLNRAYKAMLISRIGSPNSLAADLGVSLESLYRLDIGYCRKNVYSFPMRDKSGICGIRLRGSYGKWAEAGSKNALFIPKLKWADCKQLMICEGPTDCAALLDMGYYAIGRPSCMTGGADIVELLEKLGRLDVIIMADKDDLKHRPDGTGFYPGLEGAYRLATQIKPVCSSIKVIKPPCCKDIRQWYQQGATKETVDLIIRNTRYFV